MESISSHIRFAKEPLLASIEELQDPEVEREEALRVATARVVIANYALIQHDFPELSTDSLVGEFPFLAAQPITERTVSIRNIIDQWLTGNAAFISKRQAAQTVVNTRVATDGTTRNAYRPNGYGRALVVPVFKHSTGHEQSAGLLDIKGAGVSPQNTPRPGEHSDGLDYVGAALSDFALQRLIDEIFRRAAPSCWTVPTYAILDLGFDVIGGWWVSTSPAGMHVRRAHRRPHGNMDLPMAGSVEEAVKLQIEMLLRNYGLTTARLGTSFDISVVDDGISLKYNCRQINDLHPIEVGLLRRLRWNGQSEIHLEGINLQLARETGLAPCNAQMVDFGHINARETFAYPIVSLVRDRLLHLGGIIWPDDEHFIQPAPELQVPLKIWKTGALSDFCFSLAEKFRNGETSSPEVTKAIDSLIAMTIDGWPR